MFSEIPSVSWVTEEKKSISTTNENLFYESEEWRVSFVIKRSLYKSDGDFLYSKR